MKRVILATYSTRNYCTRCFHLSPKCTKIVGCWGFAPDPAGGAYSAPDSLTVMGWDGELVTTHVGLWGSIMCPFARDRYPLLFWGWLRAWVGYIIPDGSFRCYFKTALKRWECSCVVFPDMIGLQIKYSHFAICRLTREFNFAAENTQTFMRKMMAVILCACYLDQSSSYYNKKQDCLSCKPLHLNCEIKHNLNVMVCSIDLKYYEILQFNICCFLSVTFYTHVHFKHTYWPAKLITGILI